MTARVVGGPVESVLAGRDREVDRIEELVASVERGARFVVIRGDAGIGKTTLWRWALQRHRSAGHRTLVTRAVEEEMHGPIVGLVDLFADVAPDTGILSPDIDRFERGRRVLATVRRMTGESPVVIAIDDVQWLDPVSAATLKYAVRRLVDEPVVVLAAERSTRAVPPGDRIVPPDRQEEIFVGPLSLADTREAIWSVVGAVPRPTLARIHELAAGNPMYAIELARAIDLCGDSLARSLPPTLRGVLSSRLAGVPADELDVLRVAAALGPSSVAAIERVAGIAGASQHVVAAVGRGLVVVDDDHVVRFAHPLLASLVLAGLDPLERQVLHARLAGAVDGPDARARHLALSCTEPDAAVAAELDAAARRAARRGASSLAAELAGHSLRVTPSCDVEERVRRAFARVVHRAAAGDKTAALAEADELVATLPWGPVRAEAIALRVVIDFADGDRFLDQALAEAGEDDLLRGRIIELQGWVAVVYRAELARGLALGEEALSIAERLGDPALLMLAGSSVAMAALLSGQPRPQLMARALRLAAAHQGPRLGRWPQSIDGRLALWCGQLDTARVTFEELYESFQQAGMEFQRPFRLLDLADVEIASGDLARAAELVDEGMEAATDAGNQQAAAWLGYSAGVVNAHLGATGPVVDAVGLLRSRAGERDGRTRLLMAHHVVGLEALASGEQAAAAVAFAPGLAMAREIGYQLPSVVPVLPDAIEAMAVLGDATACAELSAELDGQATAVRQPWVDAVAMRGRGLAALAAGDCAAPDLLAAAAAQFDSIGYLVDAARSLLMQGRALRRAGQRNASADVLADAAHRFAIMGATPWAAQAERRAGTGRPRSAARRADPHRGPDHPTDRRRTAQPRDRRRAVRQRGHGGSPPHAHLPQAARAFAHRARPRHAMTLSRGAASG